MADDVILFKAIGDATRRTILDELSDRDGNQAKALEFYTEKLGFAKRTDVPAGEAQWLTVVSPADPDGVELLLEPDGHPAARAFIQLAAMR